MSHPHENNSESEMKMENTSSADITGERLGTIYSQENTLEPILHKNALEPSHSSKNTSEPVIYRKTPHEPVIQRRTPSNWLITGEHLGTCYSQENASEPVIHRRKPKNLFFTQHLGTSIHWRKHLGTSHSQKNTSEPAFTKEHLGTIVVL